MWLKYSYSLLRLAWSSRHSHSCTGLPSSKRVLDYFTLRFHGGGGPYPLRIPFLDRLVKNKAQEPYRNVPRETCPKDGIASPARNTRTPWSNRGLLHPLRSGTCRKPKKSRPGSCKERFIIRSLLVTLSYHCQEHSVCYRLPSIRWVPHAVEV
jgi:hypothetical protein